jgi:hypothetical protein
MTAISPLHRRMIEDMTIRKLGAKSRVEEGRGDLGPCGIVPFPFPAHRTGRGDFPHPALRPASS